jgi:hypothetical protein
MYSILADSILAIHTSFVLFVVLGLILIIIGGILRWRWVRNPWFRLAHLAAIGVVVLQTWFGKLCPLTTLEMHFRRKAGDAAYEGSFIAHWLETLIYYEAPWWVFVVAYTLFGAAVLAAMIFVRPRPLHRPRRTGV